MNKKSYFFITVIIITLTALAGQRAHEAYNKRVEEINAANEARQAQEAAGRSFTTPLPRPSSSMAFSPELSENPPSGETPATGNMLEMETNTLLTEIFNKETDEKNKELYDRYSAAIADFASRPIIQRFNADLQKAGIENVNFTDLNGPEFQKTMNSNPRLKAVLLKYAADKEFMALLQEMYNNPEISTAVKEYNESQNPLYK